MSVYLPTDVHGQQNIENFMNFRFSCKNKNQTKKLYYNIKAEHLLQTSFIPQNISTVASFQPSSKQKQH